MLKQTIILSSNINESEKLKSLALLDKPTFNVRYMSTLDLANYLLELSGVTYPQAFITNDNLSAVLYSEIKKISYFEKLSFNDVMSLIKSINDLRRYIIKDESKTIHDKLPKDIFVEKNEAIIEAYDLMMRVMDKNNLIDEVGVIRFALENIKSFPDINFVIYEKSKLLDYKLDMSLLDKAHGAVVKPTKICESNKKLEIDSYTKAFGQTNEIESILSYIYKNNISFDQCVIASAETNDYSNVLKNYSDLLGFPLTIGTGTILIETNPGKLFSMINDWMDSHYHHEYLKAIINDPSFDIEKFKKDINLPDNFDEINKQFEYPEEVSFNSIIKTVGDLRLSFDREVNNKRMEDYTNLLNKYKSEKYNEENTNRRLAEMPYVSKIVDILNKGMFDFIEAYSRITDKLKDTNALGKIEKAFSYLKFGVPYIELKKTLFDQNVGRQSAEAGKLYFTSVVNASSCLRPYLFVVGLSSNNFPGSNKEDAFLLDRDYRPIRNDDDDIPASSREIENNKNAFLALIEEAKELNVHINLSYAYYNSQTLKEQNASSVIFEVFKLENGEEKTVKDLENAFEDPKNNKFRKVEYFENSLMPTDQIGKALNNNDKIKYEPLETNTTPQTVKLDFMLNKPRGFSASAIISYAKCPYLFFLEQVLKIPQPEDVDIYEIIPANDSGTMAHYLLQTLDRSVITSSSEFRKVAEKAFDEYLIMHPADNMTLANKEKKEFVDMMATAYDMDDGSKTLFKEQDITCMHPSGIRIHGFPDKVIKNHDGSVTVIDYKTGRKITHDSRDIPSIVQCAIYSFILEENKHETVSSFEYWYLRHNHKVLSSDHGKTMQDHYNSLNIVLEDLFDSLNTGNFEPSQNCDCKNCFHRDGCPRKKKS